MKFKDSVRGFSGTASHFQGEFLSISMTKANQYLNMLATENLFPNELVINTDFDLQCMNSRSS